MRKLLLRTFFGVAVLCITQVSTVFALEYSGAWLPNDGDVNFLSFTVLSGAPNPYEVWMYDFDDQSETMMVLDSGYYSGETVYFTQGSDWTATVSGGSFITLGDDPDFGIAFLDDGNSLYEYDLEPIVEGKSYILSVSGMDLLQVDAIPQSIPDATTVFLLGSACLIGFVTSRIKKRR